MNASSSRTQKVIKDEIEELEGDIRDVLDCLQEKRRELAKLIKRNADQCPPQWLEATAAGTKEDSQ